MNKEVWLYVRSKICRIKQVILWEVLSVKHISILFMLSNVFLSNLETNNGAVASQEKKKVVAHKFSFEVT